MAQINRLNELKVKGKLEPGWHADGGNLFLRVRETGTRSWFFRYKVGGKVKEIGLGSPTERKLKDVRVIAADMRTAVANGHDPKDVLKPAYEPEAKTFKQWATECVGQWKLEWRNANHKLQWANTLERYVYPTIGDKLTADITVADMQAILTPIWTAKPETGVRVRQRVERILDYAATHEDPGRRNPARWKGTLEHILAAPRRGKNLASLEYDELPGFMAKLKAKDSTSAMCLRFAVLTAARSGEARGATWAEIDEALKVWVVPLERMKMRREHRIPLTDDALEVLTAMKARKAEDSDLIFPGPTGKRLSDVAVNKTLHDLAPGVTVHGFRSTFSTWAHETTGFPSMIIEFALAHVDNNDSRKPYARGDLFDRRRNLMVAWAKFASKVDNVTGFKGGKKDKEAA